CQAKRHRGLVVTTVGMNKSGDTVLVGDAAEIRERGEAGEFARKDTGLGLDYRPLGAGARAVRRAPQPTPRRRTARAWTAGQERLVRVYHDMGLNPRQIAERARESAPRVARARTLEETMSKFVFAYRGGRGMAATPEAQEKAMAEWGAWFGSLGGN